MGKEGAHIKFGLGNPKERDHVENLGAHGRMILKWIFKSWMEWPALIWFSIGTDWGSNLQILQDGD
jgi:hypothetical protein